MQRREFIALLGGAVAAGSRTARAQKPTTQVIGYLGASSATPNLPYTAAFLGGLEQSGFHEGRNVTVVQGSKIELVINLKTAQSLGLAVPSSLMIAADEVIE